MAPYTVPTEAELAWTPRQREVLALLAQGRTNPEIAEHLGLSLEGAKWHVREIMSKLRVESRDEAADYWRARNGLRPRLRRFATTASGIGALRWAAATAVAGAVIAGAFVGVLALTGGGGDDGADEAASTAEPAEPTTAVATAPPTPGASPTAAPASPQPGDALTIYEGAPVYELVYDERPVSLPATAALYYTDTCGVCIGGSLYRLRHGANGEWIKESLTERMTASLGAGFALNPMITDGRGSFAALWCVPAERGCGKHHDGTADDTPRALVVSHDAGITWTELLRFAPGPLIVAFHDHGRVVLGERETDADGREVRVTYRWYPGGVETTAPDPGTVTMVAGGPARLLANEPSTVFGLETFGSAPVEYFAFPGGSLGIGPFISQATFLGAAGRSSKATTNPPVARDLSGVDRLAVLVDLDARTIRPLQELLADAEFNFIDPLYLAYGPWWLVTGSVTECLNVREQPSRTAPVLACYSDGVLLADRGESTAADAVTWAAVRAPDGRAGWAAAEFLAR